MTLNSSGKISMGGSTTGESINLELGKSATAVITLNDSDARTLASKASGAIALYDFYGKSNAPSAPTGLYISTNNLTFSEPNVISFIGLTWTNTDASAQTRIYRNGSLYDTVSAGVNTYTLTESLGASLSYAVYHYKGGIESATGSSTSGTGASTGTVIIYYGATSFATPSTWNNSNNTIECIGGGQGGEGAYGGIYGGSSGQGGGYASRLNQSLSGTYTVSIGAGGAGNGSDGGDTTFSGPNTIRARGGNRITTQLGTYTNIGGYGNTGVDWAMGGCGGGGGAGYSGGSSGLASQGGCTNPAYYDGAGAGAGGTLYINGDLNYYSGAGGSGGYGNGSNGAAGSVPGGGGGGGGGSGYADDAHGGPGCYGTEIGGGGSGGAGGNGAIYITWA